MTVESIVDANEKAQPDDEGCEYCGCGLYPHEYTEEEIVEHERIEIEEGILPPWGYHRGNVPIIVLWCTNEDCENYHKPVGGFSA
jgi:hypothetical protein